MRAGEFYALLGPNGAGKTTTLRMVAGLLKPDAGSISVFGIDARAEPVAAKRLMAWVSDKPMIYDKLTPFEYLEFVAGLWGIDAAAAEPAARELLDWLGLAPHADERCEGFSRGMRQKVALAGALVHDPSLIILDEPLTGLDAGTARQVKEVLQERVRGGRTVIMTTHILEVAERMAGRIGAISGGRLIAEGTLDDLRGAGARGRSLEDVFLSLIAESAAGDRPGDARLVRSPRAPHRLAGMAGHDDREQPAAAVDRAHHLDRLFLILHLPAYIMVGNFATPDRVMDKATLFSVTISVCLYGSLMLSQAMELVTRAFYARADLDLVLSSPVPARRVFAVRIAAIALTVSTMAVLLAGPFIDILAIEGGPAWLSGYGLGFSFGGGVVAVAVGLTVALFKLLGPRRTRLIAQVVAAVVGAATVIGIQVMAILRYGTLARPGTLVSGDLLARAPDVDSPVWLPARAVMGDLSALAAVVATCFVLLGLAIVIFSGRFGEHALAASSVNLAPSRRRKRQSRFRTFSAAATLRRKEWQLLRRDPWLASQTLTQLLYLLPPALLLSRNFGGAANSTVIIVLVLVTVAGQLAGGLAWLAILGEDAPDMVASAPIPAGAVRHAKIEAVLGAVAMIFAPLLVVLAFASLSPKAPPSASPLPPPRRSISSSGSRARHGAAISGGAMSPRASLPSPKPSPPSHGPVPRDWPPAAPGTPPSPRSSRCSSWPAPALSAHARRIS